MGFEIFSRKIQRGGAPFLRFTTFGRFSFNKSATALIEKNAVENVLLMWDQEKRLIGIRPISKKDARAYKVHYNKRGDGCGFSAVTFLRYIRYKETESQSVAIRWDEQEAMFIAEVPEQYLQKEGEQPLASIARKSRKRRTKQP